MPFIEGWYAGQNAIDPRLCPYDKQTLEAFAWHRGMKLWYEIDEEIKIK